jgi:hypothetical protein
LPFTTPSRPLLPIPQLANYFSLPEKLTKRINLVYETYSKRSDALSAIREALPTDSTNIGLICSVDDTEVSLWRPFHGDRRIFHIKTQDMLKNVDCVIVNIDSDEAIKPEQEKTRSELQDSRYWIPSKPITITSKVQSGPNRWVVYRKTPSDS